MNNFTHFYKLLLQRGRKPLKIKYKLPLIIFLSVAIPIVIVGFIFYFSTARFSSDVYDEALVNAFMPVDGNITIPDTVTINTDKIIKLGTNAAFPPFEYVDGKNIVGFDISMGQKIAVGVWYYEFCCWKCTCWCSSAGRAADL